MASTSSTISISSSSSFRYHCNKLTSSSSSNIATNRVRFISRATASSKPFIVPSPRPPPIPVVPAIIIGGGKVGKTLEGMGSGNDLLVKRGESFPVDFNGPILVCTGNDDLDDVLHLTPQSRWNDLVFFQDGMVEPWFQSKGLNNPDQVLAYFAVTKLGEPPMDGKIDFYPNRKKNIIPPEVMTVAYGKWASAVATRLQVGGLFCKIIEDEADLLKRRLVKLIWICTLNLVGSRYPGSTVCIVRRRHGVEVSCLVEELASAAAAEKGVVFEERLEYRLFHYSLAIRLFPAAVKEFKWTNGWFYSLSQKAIAEGKPDPCPLHTAWLKECKIV